MKIENFDIYSVMFCKHIFGTVIFFISKTNLGCVKTPFLVDFSSIQ